MREDTSFVNYAEEGVMTEGAKRYTTDGRVCFHLAVKEKKTKPPVSGVYSVFERSKIVRDEKFNALSGRCATGDEIARIVKEELKRSWFDPDEGVTKQVSYGDIAVLVRKNRQPVTQGIIAAFTFEDIPFSACSPVCLDDFPEIKTAKDILSYIDNAEQDIPLCSSLCSPAGNFLPDELSAIRLAYPEEETFRGACRAYAREKSDDIAARLRARHGKERIRAVDKRRRRAERHERVHVRRAVPERLVAADEKLLVDDHDNHSQQKLQ